MSQATTSTAPSTAKRLTKPHVWRGSLKGLKRLMKMRGMDDAALASRVDRTPRTIQSWRVGEHHPPSQMLEPLAIALETTIGDLYTE